MKLFGCVAVLAALTLSASAGGAQTIAGGAAESHMAGFGTAVLVAGNELLASEPANTARPGLVYVYVRTANGWEESGQLRAPGAAPGDGFGQSLAADNGTLLVGVPAADEGRGAVYVFQRSSSGWLHVGRLAATEPVERGGFGVSIAVSGDWALIGAPAENQGTGAVYVFRRSGDGWAQQARLSSPDTARGSLFGNSLALLQDRAIVGMPGHDGNRGQVLVFARNNGGEWSQSQVVAADSLTPNDRFGWALAAAGRTLVASAPLNGGGGGAIFAFDLADEGTFAFQRRLTTAEGAARTVLGISVAFDGTTLLAGAPVADQQRGAVFHFTRAADGTWSAPGTLPADSLAAAAQFGGAVKISGNVAVAAVSNDDHGAGTVLVFERTGEGWTRRAALRTPSEALASIRGGMVRCSSEGQAAAFDCSDVELLSFVSIPDLGGGRGVRINDVWGWTDVQSGREYALVGRVNGMSVVDVSDPVNPVYVANLPLTQGARPATWRDIKVYRDHAFIVADGAGAHGMQVLDLTRVRGFAGTPLELTPDTTYAGINSAHNVVINEESGFAYAVGASQGGETCGGGLHMIDIREPKQPTFAGCFSDPQTGRAATGYSHDAQCVMYRGPDSRYRGREICLGSNETALSVADVTDKKNPKALSRASYPNVGYSHQGWLDEQHRYLYMNDELDELNGIAPRTRTLVWDLADLEDPQLVKEHLGAEVSSDHNLYIRGDLMYQSNYKSGLRILDISDRANPKEVAFFKTFPGDDASAGFSGSWSNYPFFESGIIVVSSIGEGLFILKKRDTTTVF